MLLSQFVILLQKYDLLGHILKEEKGEIIATGMWGNGK